MLSPQVRTLAKIPALIWLIVGICFISLAFVTFVYAAESSSSQYLNITQSQSQTQSSNQKRDVEYVKNIVVGLNQLLVGDPQKVAKAVYDSQQSGNPNPIYASTGALGSLTYIISQMYTQMPISGVQYLTDVGENIGLVKSAHAQTGGGFAALAPIQDLWRAMRNLAYLGFVIVFVVTGFMIMFRARIDPRTVASIADSLPRIVIALILVTFSYALSGLVLDLIGVSVKLIATVFDFASENSSISSIVTTIQTPGGEGGKNIFDLMKSIIPSFEVSSIFGSLFVKVFKEIPVLGALGSIPGLSTFAGGIFGLILVIAIIFSMFRVFIMLLTSLVTIILLTIFSPLQFLVSALPGRGGVLTGWARGILSAALVFPVTFAMLLLAAVFAKAGPPWNIELDILNSWTYSPPPLGYFFDSPSEAGEFLARLIAVGILLTTPQAANIVRDALGQRPSPYLGGAGGELAGAARRLVPFF